MGDSNTQYFWAKYDSAHTEYQGQKSARLGCPVDGDDGVYARWDWNGDGLVFENDLHGFTPLFFYEKDGEFCLSSSIERILQCGVKADLDERALSIFLRLGFFIRHDTPFAHIKAVPPNSRGEWRSGNLSISQKSSTTVSPISISRTRAVEGYIDRFKAAIEKRLPENDKYMIPLSGGRDSRHIFLEFVARGMSPRAITHLPNPNCSYEDVRVAKMLAEATAVEHIIVPQSRRRLKMELEKNRRTSFCSDESAQMMVVAEYLESHGIEAVYDGIGGDTLSEGKLFIPSHIEAFRAGRYDELADCYLKQWNNWSEETLAGLIRPDVLKRMSYACAKEYLIEELSTYKDCHNPIQQFIFYNRTRREIGLIPFGILQHIKNVHCPYLDKDLSTFLMSLPMEVLEDATFHTEAIARGYPEFADVPYDRPGQGVVQAPDIINPLARDFAWFGLTHQWPSRLVNRKFMTPRLLKGIFQPGFVWHGYGLVIFLLQLEDCVRKFRR